MKVSASVVLYKTAQEEIATVYHDILSSRIEISMFLVDNSPIPCLDPAAYPQARYLFSGSNLGFGSAHNVAIKAGISEGCDYHIIINPDVHFSGDVIPKLLELMENDADIGCAMPKILNLDGSVQHLCRLLPTPMDLIGRRFLRPLLPKLVERMNSRYELSALDHERSERVPILSGCFLAIRTRVVKQVGMFDESFFMYLEDYDLVRRIGTISKTIYHPVAVVYHAHAKMSYRSLRATLWHMRSAILYFSKWGWLKDDYRKSTNRDALSRIGENISK